MTLDLNMRRTSRELAKRMVEDARAADPFKVAGFVVNVDKIHEDANEIYYTVKGGFEKVIQQLKDAAVFPKEATTFIEAFDSYGFPRALPHIEHLDLVFFYLTIKDGQTRGEFQFFFIGGAQIRYTTNILFSPTPLILPKA